MSSDCHLTIGKKVWSIAVALASQIRGAINAGHNFLLHFCIRQDWK